MEALLSGLDETFFSAVPSSSPLATQKYNTHQKQHVSGSRTSTPTKNVKPQYTDAENISQRAIDVQDIDMDALCDGVLDLEDWDIDKAFDDDMKPNVPQSLAPPPLIRDPLTRCEVLQVTSFDYSEKVSQAIIQRFKYLCEV